LLLREKKRRRGIEERGIKILRMVSEVVGSVKLRRSDIVFGFLIKVICVSKIQHWKKTMKSK